MRRLFGGALLLALGAELTAQAPRPRTISPSRSAASRPDRFTPRFEAVAETRFLMEGLATPNYRGLEDLLRRPPAELETWKFIRGQALLLAETGNLLLLRPPKNEGQDTWFRRATDLRAAATALARAAQDRDLNESRVGLVNVASACNRCHQSFRVPVKIGPEPVGTPPPPEPRQ